MNSIVLDSSLENSPGKNGSVKTLASQRRNMGVYSVDESERVADPVDADKLIVKAAPMSGIDEENEVDEKGTAER